MLACDQTITVIKGDGEHYTFTAIVGASWFEKAQIKVEGMGLVFSNAVQIRIPSASLPLVLPEVGDQIIKGVFSPNFTAERPTDLTPYHPKKIVAVGDNRRGNLPHVAVVCQ